MRAYLTLTLEQARQIEASGQTEHWTEARVFLLEAIGDGRWEQYPDREFDRHTKAILEARNGPEYFAMTFVRWEKDVPQIRACRGQCIAVIAPRQKTAFHYGQPINDREPILYAMRVETLLASIRQPKQLSITARKGDGFRLTRQRSTAANNERPDHEDSKDPGGNDAP